MKKFITITLLLLSSIVFSQIDSTYYFKSKRILENYPKSRITAQEIFNAAQEVYSKNGIFVPCELVIAQGVLETSLGRSGVGIRNNNVFSIKGNGSYKVYKSTKHGLIDYYHKISESYLKNKTINQLLNNFRNINGYRYASSKKYEIDIKRLYTSFIHL